MQFEVVFSAEAILSYQAIQAQIEQRFGKREVGKFEKRVLKTLALISKFPLSFQTIDEDSTVHKGLVHKNCSLFYQIEEFKIEVLFFWDNRQEPIF